MILLFMIMAFDVPEKPKCIIDRCEGGECVIETPEGWVSVPRQAGYYEGKAVHCPMRLIEPT